MKRNGRMMTGRRKKKKVSLNSNALGFRISPFKVVFYSFMGVFGYNYYLNLYKDLPEENFGK